MRGLGVAEPERLLPSADHLKVTGPRLARPQNICRISGVSGLLRSFRGACRTITPSMAIAWADAAPEQARTDHRRQVQDLRQGLPGTVELQHWHVPAVLLSRLPLPVQPETRSVELHLLVGNQAQGLTPAR